VGIYAVGGSDVQIKRNTINYLGVGISVVSYEPVGGATHSIVNFQICENNVSGSYHRGIDIDMDAASTIFTVSGLQVDNNRVFFQTKSASGLPAYGNELYGIRFYAAAGGGKTAVLEGLSFCDNNIYYCVNAAAGSYGMSLSCPAGAGDTTALVGLRVDNNQVEAWRGADSQASVGIYARFANQDDSWANSLCSNIVASEIMATNVASFVYGIYADVDDHCKVNDNVVNVLGNAGSVTTRGVGIYLAQDKSQIVSNKIQANWLGVYATGADVTISENQIESNGIAVLTEDAGLISANQISVTTVNATLNAAQPTASCGGIVSSGDGVSVLDNTVVMSGHGAPINLPDEVACIFVSSDSTQICNNSTRLGNLIVNVNGNVAPLNKLLDRAYHIYYGTSGTVNTATVSQNKINNFDNSANLINGLYVEYLAGAPTHTHVTVTGNTIKGGKYTSAVAPLTHTVPCHVDNFPYNFGNLLLGTGVNVVYLTAFSNVILAENAPTAAEYPTVYFLIAGNTTQEPFTNVPALGNNWVTNLSPGAYF